MSIGYLLMCEQKQLQHERLQQIRKDFKNIYGAALHTAAKARGFYELESANEVFSLCQCDDSGNNRSLLITAMCSGFHARLDQVEKIGNAQFNLALYRIESSNRGYQLLF